MQDSFKNTLFGLVLFVLFSSLIITATISISANYGRDSAEIGDGALDVDAFNEGIEDVSEKAGNYRQRFESGDVDDIDDPSGVFSIVTDMITMITTPFTLLAQVLSNLLGVPTLFINIVLGLLGVSLIFGIWRFLRTGD